MAMRLPVVPAAFAIVLCVLAPVGVGAGKKVEVKETTFDSAISDVQWFGKDNKMVLVQTSKGRLYRSTDGGDKWTDITDQLKPSSSANIVVEQLSKSQADDKVAAIVGTQKNHFVTKDGGATWRPLRQDSTIHTFMFHKTRPQWALLSTWTPSCEVKKYGVKAGSSKDGSSPCNHVLYLTKDLGRTFQLVSSYVVQFSWGDAAHKQEDRIYLTHFRQKKGDQPRLYLWSKEVDLSYTDDGKNVKSLVPQGNKFLVSHNFLFVAMLKDSTSQTVRLKVSADGGKSFSDAKLPQELEEKSYSILDTSEGAVMLHVNHGSKDRPSGVGNIYISDKDGLRYSLSLPNNVRSSSGDCEFDRVVSLDGVYLANIKEEPARAASGEDLASGRKAEAAKEDEELEQSSAAGTEVERRRSAKAKAKQESIVRTVITFDRGGQWSYLKPPKVDSLGKKIECPPDKCWLHLHGITNFRNYAPFYSTSNAIGIIMGTGNTGPYLRFEEDQTNTYMSRDGGLTWVEVHKGAYIYEYGDHGGLVLMADDIRKTKQVVFSWNEGQSWYDFELSKLPLEVDNIVTEPNATSTRFLLYGTRSDVGVLYHLNFEALGQPLCSGLYAVDSVSSDYETWTPSDGRGGADRCILGRQVTYTRRKQTSECFNGEKFERPAVRKNCKCTEEDFECEMGFVRKVGADSMSACRFADDGSVPIPPKCTSSDIFHADAYRKVVGDTCEGGWKPTPLAVPCPAGSKLSRGALSVLGTVGIIGAILAAVTFMSRSEHFKGVFANYGFENFENVKYATIGAKVPETAAESIGANYDHGDFDQDDRDEFAGDTQMMSYNSASPNRGRDLPERRSNESASAPVPRLARPPGSGGGGGTSGAIEGQDLELL